MSHIPDQEPFDVRPGDEYVVYGAVAAGLNVNWRIYANGPFDVKVKGLRWFLIVPNPFNSDWQPADGNFRGVNGIFGKDGNDGGVVSSLYLVVRSASPVRMRRTANFVVNGAIYTTF